MLDIIRKQKESPIIKLVFIVIVLSFIGTIFLVWGKGSDGMGGGGGYAAKVNGSKISLEQYQNAYQRIRNMYQQIYGQSIPAEMEKMLGLKKVALDGLIDNLLVAREAKSMGIKVTKEEVASSIEAMPMFQKDGKFSFDQYQQILKSSRITAKDFEKGQEAELMLTKARQSIKDKAVVSDADALAQFKKNNDKIELEFMTYSPADVMAEVKLTEAELGDFLQKNQNDFKTQEKVALSYVLMDVSSLAAKTSVSDEEIQTFYQKNIDRWQGKDGIMPLNDVKDKVKQEAIRQKAAKQAYEQAADTLFKNIKTGDLKLVAGPLGLKIHETPLFPANAPVAELAGEAAVVKKAIELKEGELGGPVETPRGIYIIKARERKAAVVPPLADIRGAVEEKARVARSIDLAKQKAEETAKQLSAKAALKTQATGSFGYSAKGDIPAIGASPELVEAVFKLTTGQAPATPYKIGNRWFAVRVKNRIEAPQADFQKTKEEIKKSMLPKHQEEALAAWTKTLRDKAKIEINQALIADK